MVRALKEGENVPCPAEDLSADDDLLSWILVDQLGCLPGKGLGVHPQQVKFVGTPFKTSEVLKIVSETVVNKDKDEAKRRLLDFHLIKAHLETKVTEKQRIRFVNHLVRYTLPYRPDSRIEIFTTDRYKAVTGHGELAVYATRPLAVGTLVQELQGSIVPLPDQWRDEMDIGEDFAMEAAGDEESEGESEGDEEEEAEDDGTAPGTSDGRPTKKGKKRKEPKGARRSDRTKRRDFSIMWSEKDKRYQLFLGPARFLNHDCEPNVKLSRQGQYVTFRVDRPVKIGDEITTDYGPNYFGKDNIECLCLTCEKRGKGGFTKKSDEAEAATGTCSPSIPTSTKPGSSAGSRKPMKPSELRNALGNLTVESNEDESEPVAGPSGTSHEDSTPVTPRKPRPKPSLLSISRVDSPATEATGSEPDSPSEGGPPQRKRYQRKAAKNAQHFNFLKRPRKGMETDEPELLMDEKDIDCERCATCAVAIQNREWDKLNNRYWEFCLRCIRHALIFDLPWPAHHSSQVCDYPPSHLIPRGYIAPRVSTIPLPSLEKNRKKHVEPAPVAPQAVSAAEKAAMKFRRYLAFKDLQDGQLHEEAWTTQETIQNQLQAAEQAKIEAREKRLEAKRLLEENKFKGSGIWNRWQYIDDAEHERREAAKNAITTGTRRGRRFKANEDEEEEKRLAEKIAAERRAEARAVETDSDDERTDDDDVPTETDADDEAEEHEEDNEGEGGDRPQLQIEHDEEMEDVKPIISPKAIVSPTRGAYNANSIINQVRDVIDITWMSDTSNGEFENESSGEDSITTKTRRLERKDKKRIVKVDSDKEGSDSDCAELSAYIPRSARKSGGVLMPSAAKLPLSPVRRTAKTKPSGKSKPRRKAMSGVENVDEAGLERETDHGGRGRGRPAGTGKRQKAAAARRTSLAQAGPSNATKHRSSLKKHAQVEEHIQTRVEKELAKMDQPFFEIAVEGMNKDGKLIWKSTSELCSNPFDFGQAAIEIIVKEKMEHQASLAVNREVSNDNATAPQKFDRKLPGQVCLLSAADVRAWGPPLSGEPEDIARLSINSLTTSILPPGASPGEVVGLVLDSGTVGYGRPSLTEGPWADGEFRKIVAIQRTPNDGGDAISAMINDKVGWNEESRTLSSAIVTPIIKFIKSPNNGPPPVQISAGGPAIRLNGSTSRSPVGVSRDAGHPVNSSSREGSSDIIELSTTVRIPSRHSAAPSKSATPRKVISIAPKQAAGLISHGPSATPAANGHAPTASATPSQSVARPSGATPTISSLGTPGQNRANGFSSRHSATPSKQLSKNDTPTKTGFNALDQPANGIVNGSTSSSTITPSKSDSRPAVSASITNSEPLGQTSNGSASHSSATPSQSISRSITKTATTPQRPDTNASTPRPTVAPSKSVNRPNGSTPAKTAPMPIHRTADESAPIPITNGTKGTPLHTDSDVNGSASEENGFSTGTSLAEEEVEDVLDGARKRKLSVTDSPRRIKLTI